MPRRERTFACLSLRAWHPHWTVRAFMETLSRLLMLTCFASSLVWAKPTGITGFSGLATRTCNNCHSGGADPSLSLEGPEVVTVGDDVTFILSIAGGASQIGGLDVSAGDAGVELIP